MSNTKTPTTLQQLDYSPLLRVLTLAYEQATAGKGRERHANDRDFDRQPILEVGRITGMGGTSFQAMKKIGEAVGMNRRGENDKAVRELIGAIVYCAATAVLCEEEHGDFQNTPVGLLEYETADKLPSPIKKGEPCVRITEEEWLRLKEVERKHNAARFAAKDNAGAPPMPWTPPPPPRSADEAKA